MTEGWPDFWIRGKKIDLIDLINEINTIHTIETVNSITSISTLDTINTINTVNTIDTINKIRDISISEERRRDAIKNGFFNQALTGWYVDYVEIQDTDDPYFIAGYDAVLTSSDSNLVQYLIPFMRKDEVYSLQIRCKGAASGTLDVMFIDPSGNMSSYPVSISSSYATYTVDIPYDVVAGIWIYPTDASIIPCRIKFVSAPLKTKVYQAEKDRTISNFPSEYPLPSSQVSDLKNVSVTNFPSEYPLPSTQVTDLKNVSISREGAYTPFSVEFTASGTQTIYTPSSGKKAQVLGWSLYNKDDVRIEIRYETSHNVIAALPSSGASAMNLIGLNPPTGDTDEAIQVAAWGATTVKGWLSIREV